MSTIASKNLYDLLGNDPELDPDRAPDPPVKVADRPVQRSGKRNEGPKAGRQEVVGRPDAGNNRSEQRDDGLRQDRHANRNRDPREHPSSAGGRGARGGRGRGARGGEYRGTRTARDDRHSRTGIEEHDKQAEHGWGEASGAGELADEKAGQEIANAEVKNEAGLTPDAGAADPAFSSGPDGTTGEGEAAEPEDNTKSYADYLAEQAEKRAAIGGNLEIRKANEGSKQKFPEGKAHARNVEEENYFAGSGGKQLRQKENKSKNFLAMDGQYYAPPESDRRGGREGGRGGRGRGEGGRGGGRGRGDGARGRGEGRGRGGPRGGPRGDAANNGPRGNQINVTDESAFPSLG